MVKRSVKLFAGNVGSGTINLSGKISDYRFILIFLGDGMITFASYIMPADFAPNYQSASNTVGFGIDTMRLSARAYGIVTYKSDTQLYAQVSPGNDISIYGVG